MSAPLTNTNISTAPSAPTAPTAPTQKKSIDHACRRIR